MALARGRAATALTLLQASMAVVLGIVMPSNASAQQRWKVAHVAVQTQIGGTDSNYPGCNGRMLAFAGASVEVGTPRLLEFFGDAMGAGGEDCAPLSAPREPGGEHGNLESEEPSSRWGVGVGHRFADRHGTATLRIGSFNTREPYISGKITGRLFVFTLGFELGKVRGHWRFDNGVDYHNWSTFGGLSLGLWF